MTAHNKQHTLSSNADHGLTAPSTADANADNIWSSSAIDKKALVLQDSMGQTASLLELQNDAGETYFSSLNSGTTINKANLEHDFVIEKNITGEAYVYDSSEDKHTFDGSSIIFNTTSVSFEVFPIGPSASPTTDYQFANKKYVDDAVSGENLWDRVDDGGGLYHLETYNENDGAKLFNGSSIVTILKGDNSSSLSTYKNTYAAKFSGEKWAGYFNNLTSSVILVGLDSALAVIGDSSLGGNVTIGAGQPDVDYTITFDGETNDGVITWMEDEDQFTMNCSLQVNSLGTYKATLGDEGNTAAGSFEDGTRTTKICDGINGITSTDGGYTWKLLDSANSVGQTLSTGAEQVRFVDNANQYAGYFQYGSLGVTLADSSNSRIAYFNDGATYTSIGLSDDGYTGLYMDNGSTKSIRLLANTNSYEYMAKFNDGNNSVTILDEGEALSIITNLADNTSTNTSLNISAGGTFDTTVTGSVNYGIYSDVNGTKSAGSNNLVNYGLYTQVTGADINIGAYIYTAARTVNLADDFLGVAGRFTGGAGGVDLSDTNNAITASGDIQMTSGNAFYLGDKDTDGTWRIVRENDNLVFERRESGTYVNKSTMTP
jgi:hypothetical protein